MKIQINLRGWVINNAFTQLILAPFFYAIYPIDPFGVGVACGIAGMAWIVIIIFWLGKRNGIEIK